MFNAALEVPPTPAVALESRTSARAIAHEATTVAEPIDLEAARRRLDAEQFVTALTGSADTLMTWQVLFDARSSERCPEIRHGPLAEHWPWLEAKNREGYGVFAMINEGDGHGRTELNVTAPRALFIDEDGKDHTRPAKRGDEPRKRPEDVVRWTAPGVAPFAAVPPSLTVQSKSGQHQYWILRPGELAREFATARAQLATFDREIETMKRARPPAVDASQRRRHYEKVRAVAFNEPRVAFARAQRTLAKHFNTDPSISDLPRVMRVPGFFHQKDPTSPFLVRIVQNNASRYSIEEVLNAYPLPVGARLDEPLRVRADARDVPNFPPASEELRERAGRYLAAWPDPIVGGGSDQQVFKMSSFLVCDLALTVEEALPILKSVCLEPGFDDDWLLQKLGNAYKYAKGEVGWRRAEFEEAAKATRPDIFISVEQTKVVDQAIRALKQAEGVFVRAGKLVRIVRSPNGPPKISALPLPTIQELLSAHARFHHFDTKAGQYVPACPPEWCVQMVAARGEWPGLRPLAGIVETPILRPDGSVLDEPGYDPATGLFYEPIAGAELVKVPERPTRDDAKRAVEQILACVAEFPFADDASRSMFLAALLTPFARPAFEGPTPLFLVDANTAGTGKTLLSQVLCLIAFGRLPAPSKYTDDDAEMRKVITTKALEGARYVFLDNIPNGVALGTSALDIALTSTTWEDRYLGRNESTGSLPLNALFLATGNNVTLEEDVRRRVSLISLVTAEERPEERAGFQHPDLIEHVSKHRTQLAAAALTILHAYEAEGRPKQPMSERGSYGGWSRVVRAALIWAGQTDPEAGRAKLNERDSALAAAGMLIDGWKEVLPGGEAATASAMLQKVRTSPEKYTQMRQALLECLGVEAEKANAKTLGKKLSGLRNRICGGWCFRSRQNASTKVSEWWVEEISAAPPGAAQ